MRSSDSLDSTRFSWSSPHLAELARSAYLDRVSGALTPATLSGRRKVDTLTPRLILIFCRSRHNLGLQPSFACNSVIMCEFNALLGSRCFYSQKMHGRIIVDTQFSLPVW